MSRRHRLNAVTLEHVVDLGPFTGVGEPPVHRRSAFEKTIEQNRDAIRVLYQYPYGVRGLIERIRGFRRPAPGEPPPPEPGEEGQEGAPIQRDESVPPPPTPPIEPVDRDDNVS